MPWDKYFYFVNKQKRFDTNCPWQYGCRPKRYSDVECTNCHYINFGSKLHKNNGKCTKCSTHIGYDYLNQYDNKHGNQHQNANNPRKIYYQDWNCLQCKFMVFGSKSSCPKCHTHNPNRKIIKRKDF